MNKEAIERTKARCKDSQFKYNHAREGDWSYLDWPSNHKKVNEMLNENQQLFNQFRNPKHMPTSYYIPEINLWEPLTPKQHLFTALVSLSIIALVIWWAK